MLTNYRHGLIDGTVSTLKNSLQNAQVSGKVLIGNTISSIAQEAENWKPDLIIICARKRSWFLKFFFEDISKKLIKLVNCKV